MKSVKPILGIILAITFVLPIFWVVSFSPWGWLSLFTLGLANYLYLLSKSVSVKDFIKKMVLMTIFLLFLIIGNWAQNVIKYKLGIGLVAGYLMMGGMAVLAGYLEIATINNLVVDLPNFITLIGNWRGTKRRWMLLALLLPLGAHFYVIYQGGLLWYWNKRHPEKIGITSSSNFDVTSSNNESSSGNFGATSCNIESSSLNSKSTSTKLLA